MEAYYEILSRCPLFAGISREEMPEILGCLDKRVAEIPKGDPVFLAGCRSSGMTTTEEEAC